MTSYWPKDLNPKDFSPEDRTVIKVNERLRLMEVSIKELQEAKKK